MWLDAGVTADLAPRLMDMTFSSAHVAFREEVRAFIKASLPGDLARIASIDGHFEFKDVMRWHRILAAKGWVAPFWPQEYGGPGWDATRRFIFNEELELSGAPSLLPFGLSMVGPLLIQFGSEAQKRRFLPRILSGDEVWCQGYSEPNAGSDLASLKTQARDDGQGHFIVDGQKTWTTYAQYADWIFALVRTDPAAKKQAGISFLLIDLRSPGVTVRPLLTLGGTPSFSETWFDGVRVPKENLVGQLHGGWALAKALLGHERTGIAAVGLSRRALRRVKLIAGPLLLEPGFRAKVARMEVKLKSLEMANYRALAGAQLGHAPGPESSILKIRGSEVLQQMYELSVEVMGPNSMSWFNPEGIVPADQEWVASSFNYLRATTIYGGSNEIQRNVIAKLILRLPGA